MSETAGFNATNDPDKDDKSLTTVKYQDNFVYTTARRFVVVRAKREFAYAW